MVCGAPALMGLWVQVAAHREGCSVAESLGRSASQGYQGMGIKTRLWGPGSLPKEVTCEGTGCEEPEEEILAYRRQETCHSLGG